MKDFDLGSGSRYPQNNLTYAICQVFILKHIDDALAYRKMFSNSQ